MFNNNNDNSQNFSNKAEVSRYRCYDVDMERTVKERTHLENDPLQESFKSGNKKEPGTVNDEERQGRDVLGKTTM